MKKISLFTILIIVLVICAVLTTGCSDYFTQYFNTYTSTPLYTSAEETLSLSAGVKIGEYFGDDYFSIYKESTSMTSFGIATKDKVIIEPGISDKGEYFVYVVDVSDNYAILVKKYPSGNGMDVRLGAVYLSGENRYTDIVGFNYFVAEGAEESDFDFDKLDPSTLAIRIVGDYIVVIGDITNNNKNNLDTKAKLEAVTYYTFYQYNEEEGKLEEKFKIKSTSNDSTSTLVTINTAFDEMDGYVLRYDDYNSTYGAYFAIYYYRVTDIDEDGYLTMYHKYQPYSVDNVKSLWISDSGVYCSYEVTSYYLGNGIFLRKAAFFSTEPFDGYMMVISPSESPLLLKSYGIMKSDRINLTGASAKTYANNNVFPYEVVNEYNEKVMRSLVDYYNGSVTSIESLGDTPLYQYPFYATSSIIANGYSIVYTHYFPDMGNEAATEEEQKTAPVSYILYNNNDLSEQVLIDSTLMPVVFIDEVGMETYSIDFDQTFDFSAELFDLDNNVITLEDAVITEDESKIYRAYVYHDGYAIVGEFDAKNENQNDYKKGVFSYDGKEAVQIIPYKYDELTPFFGGYATGTIWDVKGKKKTFYRIDSNGEETVINNCYSLHNGCYITRLLQTDGTYLYSLFSNSGRQLIDYTGVTGLRVMEEFLTDDGKFVETTVIVTVDGHDKLYKLK